MMFLAMVVGKRVGVCGTTEMRLRRVGRWRSEMEKEEKLRLPLVGG